MWKVQKWTSFSGTTGSEWVHTGAKHEHISTKHGGALKFTAHRRVANDTSTVAKNGKTGPTDLGPAQSIDLYNEPSLPSARTSRDNKLHVSKKLRRTLLLFWK